MPEAEPRLRPVSALSEPPERRRGRRGAGSGRVLLVLGIALGVAILALLWTRIQLGGRIGALETRAAELERTISEREATLAERERTIEAQSERLGEVRKSVEDVLTLLDEPVQ